MRECPNCHKEYADDVVYCLEDGTVLEDSVKPSEAETVSLPADAVPPTVLVKEDDVKTEVLETKETVASEDTKPVAKTAYATASSGGEMTSSSKLAVLLAIILLAGVGLLVWKVKVGDAQGSDSLTKLTKEDMETIFKDAPPMALKRLAEDPELKKKQIEQIKEFLAIAEEARKSGFADKEENKADLEEIRMTITALNYDKEKNKDKENLPPFASVTKEEVDAFFQKDDNQAKFDKMLNEQIESAKKDGRIPENFQLQPEQLDQAKAQYAKVRIYAEEAKKNWASLSEEFKKKTELQIKLQQAQYLEQKYSTEVIAKKIAVTPEEENNYLSTHPEEAKIITEKKAKAQEILNRAKAGEDFAKLAQEFTEDPGSKKDGGLYKDVAKGSMVPEFEQAALALEPGQIADNLVESKYGYHIIKLERKGITKDKDGKEKDTYDARHILISTMSGAGDPNNPMAQPLPLKEKIKEDIEKEKRKKLIDEIVARNPIEVAENFEIKVPEGADQQPPPGGPQLTPEQMEQLQKQLKEAQEKGKNAPKGKDGSKPASNTKSAGNAGK